MTWVTPPTHTTGYFVTAANWNQDVVENTVALRTGAVALGSQAAQDFLYASSATQLGRLAAVGGKYPRFNGTTWEMAAAARACQGRLTLTTGTPVTTADVTAAGTLYFTPMGGNVIEVYDGTQWKTYAFAELSLALTVIADTNYDVFVYDNAGTLTLELQPWTNSTTRAIALAVQDGVYVKTGVLSRRYLGTMRASGTNVAEDSIAKRYLWNYYNRGPRIMRVFDPSDSWTYTLLAFRQANANPLNQLDLVVGVADVMVEAVVLASASNTSVDIVVRSAIGYDSTTVAATGCLMGRAAGSTANVPVSIHAHLRHYPAVGRHVYPWLELSQASGTTTWFGDDTAPDIQQCGILGSVEG